MYRCFFSGKDLEFVGRSYGKKLEAHDLKTDLCIRFNHQSWHVFWLWHIHSVRRQSVFFNLTLTERNMQIKFYLKLSVYSLDLDIWPLTFEFNFGLIGWPPQPPRERVPKINKILYFWWSTCFIPMKISQSSCVARTGRNFDDYSGFHPKTTTA